MDAVDGYRLQQLNPGRPLSWRWRLAFFLSSCGRLASSQDDDPATISAVRFLAAIRAGRKRATLDHQWPGLRDALALVDQDDARQRWELEARLLAGQDDQEIGSRCGMKPAVVSLYEQLFFNVRDRLKAVDWIATQAIGPGLWRGFRPDEIGGIWRAVGYYGGALALDVIISQTRDGLPIGPAANQAAQAGDEAAAATRKLILALMVPPNADPLRLFEVQLGLRKHKGGPKGSAATRKPLKRATSIVESLVAQSDLAAGRDKTALANIFEASPSVATQVEAEVRAPTSARPTDNPDFDSARHTEPKPRRAGSQCRRKQVPRAKSSRPASQRDAGDEIGVAGDCRH